MNTKNFNYGSSEIEQFLSSVRDVDNSIGNYEQHSILSDDFTYSIKLTNGTIRIYVEELLGEKVLPQERFMDIAARFRKRKSEEFN